MTDTLASLSHKKRTKTLITCHINADFDAFASIIGAYLLYPDALLFFPGTQERTLHTLYTEQAIHMYPFVKNENIAWETITRLVVVDTRQRVRLSHVQPLLERDDISLVLWDHHPDTGDDLASEHSTVATVGATATLLTNAIRANNIEISAQDATMLGLGIYTDTGSFTYSSTTPSDYIAAAWLREQGMDVTTITNLTAHELTSAHIQTLHALLESTTNYTVGEVTVTIADVSMEHYMGDFALLAHKLMEMERVTVLFALGRMHDRIIVVARSRSDIIDVGHICAALGGGGHAYAASASVRDKTMQQVRQTILQYIYTKDYPQKRARDYMSSPPFGISIDKTMHDAHMLMAHFGFKAIPILDKESQQCVGILDAHIASRAVNHRLDDIETYMQRDITLLSPEAPLSELIETIVDKRQRLVPIVENEKIIGVVTRTDLIHIFVDAPDGIPITLRESRKERLVRKLMRDRLKKDIYTLLETAGKLGDSMNINAYAVGGFVRDLLLGRPNYDIDLVVEGDGITFARALAKAMGGIVREHEKYLTAIVTFTGTNGTQHHIDVATARLEYYEHPAASPTVQLSSIKQDLFRRDFTMNTLAIRLSENNFGLLVDFFGAQRDINDQRIRVLHSLSFVEDPTRCLRAVRFEQRYGFVLGAGAKKLLTHTLQLHIVDKLAGARLFHEWSLLFDEANPLACLQRLDELGILQALHPQLALSPQAVDFLGSIKEILDWYQLLYYPQNPNHWLIYQLGLMRTANYQTVLDLLTRLGISQLLQDKILQLRKIIRKLHPQLIAWHEKKESVSQLCAHIEHATLEVLLYIMARNKDLRGSLSHYITTWQHETIDITGKDLIALGLAPGPLMGTILRHIKAAKLDGHVTTTEEQYALAKQLACQQPGAAL